jgi:hypothetical protein
MAVSGRTGRTGERWAFRAPDGSTQYWDPRADNRCFREGLGLGPNGALAAGRVPPRTAMGVRDAEDGLLLAGGLLLALSACGRAIRTIPKPAAAGPPPVPGGPPAAG